MTELQQCEFNILKASVDVCNKLDIKYFLVCGSALGAVKYQGFIPWDDDIDVGMYREDYERFLKEAPALLPDGLFLQSHKSDENYPHIFAKIRDNNTTFVESSVAHLNINHGVYIDIFPLDAYPLKKSAQRKLERKKWKYSRQIACVFNVKRGLKGRVLKFINQLLAYDVTYPAVVKKYEKAIAYYKGERGELICNHGNWQGRLEYAEKEQYGDGVMMKFEGLDVRVPAKYDRYLTQKYGDWRADLPKDQQEGHHYHQLLDLNRSYAEYIESVSKDKMTITWKSNQL